MIEFLPPTLLLLLSVILLDFSKGDKTGRLLRAIGWLSLYTGVASLFSHLLFGLISANQETAKHTLILNVSLRWGFIGAAIVYFFLKRKKEWSEFRPGQL